MRIAKKKGFTLIELLVVMAIIMILASLAMQSWIKARRRVVQTKCLNNLKQIGMSLHIYALDYKQKFPNNGIASNGKKSLQILKTTGYIRKGNLFVCPAGNAISSDTATETENTDYRYDQTMTEYSHSDSAIANDDQLDNHQGPRGVNVIYVDGHAESKADLPLNTTE